MKILHLCSYYIGNKLYSNLFSKLNNQVDNQTIYIPVRIEGLINRNKLDIQGLDYHYDLILNKHDRYFYKSKIKKQKKSVELKTSIESYDMIHSHTLFSDGGTAYLLKQKYGIKYIINIRNTDIHVFYKYAIYLRPFIYKVLTNASAIVFISPAYKKKTLDLLPDKIVNYIKEKVYVIPNGIDEKWFKKDIPEKKEDFSNPRLLFTGTLDKNKNLGAVLKLVKKLHEDGIGAYLNIAGDGVLLNKYKKLTLQMKLDKYVKFFGKISKEELINITDDSDVFILPSYKETFGISYIEAMSRGLPVIYTRNEGIDGYFPEGKIGYSTNPDDIIEMEAKLNAILNNIYTLSSNCIIEAKRFNWPDIANEYFELYSRL